MSVWQPIETAPKDGKAVDLWHKDGYREAAATWGLPPHSCGEMGRYCDCEWHSYKEGWVIDFFDEPLGDACFTHWMPPPPPPETNHD